MRERVARERPRHRLAHGRPGEAGGHQAELVAAEPCGRRPGQLVLDAAQHVRHGAQQVVAGVVAVLVVDALEAVHVAHDDAGLVDAVEGGLGGVVGDPAVAEARERVVGDEVAHLVLEVDPGDRARDEAGQHLRRGHVVDLEERLPGVAGGVHLAPHGLVDDDRRGEA